MDVFTLGAGQKSFLLRAAEHAGHELGLFGALGEAPRTAEDLAAQLGAGAHRLRALLDVLRLESGVRRVDGGYVRGTPPARRQAPPRAGWGRIAEVLRRDRPLVDEPIDHDRFHAHLLEAGDAAARALAARLPAGSLLDLGGGAGVYTRAYLDEHPGARATLVDKLEILPLAQQALGRRADLVAADLLHDPLPAGHDIVLLANVLHLYSAADCASLCARAAAALAPRGRVVVKDLRMEPDRSGPPSAVLFALNMALYTEGGDVHDPDEIAAFLTAAGLGAVAREPLGDDAVVVTGAPSPP